MELSEDRSKHLKIKRKRAIQSCASDTEEYRHQRVTKGIWKSDVVPMKPKNIDSTG